MLKQKNILSEVPLFGGLPPEEMERLSSVSVPLEVEKGTLIFSEGDMADGFYVVVKGMVKICKVSSDGKEKILHMFGPPEPFGEVPVFAGDAFSRQRRGGGEEPAPFLPQGCLCTPCFGKSFPQPQYAGSTFGTAPAVCGSD